MEIHGTLFEVLDRDSESSILQQVLTNPVNPLFGMTTS